MTHTQPVLVSIDTARSMLGDISKTTIFAMIAAGELETLKLGRRRLVRASSIYAIADRAVAA
jgi:excisionase family DNA binding protein